MESEVEENNACDQHFSVDGVKVYDPRDNTFKVSDNPDIWRTLLKLAGFLLSVIVLKLHSPGHRSMDIA